MSIIVTARGTLRGGDTEVPKKGHNEIFARSLEQTQGLGLIGHRVFGSLRDPRSFLLVEQWTSPEGAGQFFGDPEVQQAIGSLFEEPPDLTFWALRDGWTGLGRLDAPEIVGH